MRPGVLRVIIGLAVLVSVVGFLLVGAVGVCAVFMPDCARCHMQGQFKTATEHSSHSTLPCRYCHGGTTVQQRWAFGRAQVFGMYLRVSTVDPSLSYVESAKCAGCHQEQLASLTNSNGLRIVHASCDKGRECVQCHSTVAHGVAVKWPRTYDMNMCFDCHGKNGVTAKCDACHVSRLPSDRIKSGPFSVLHGKDWKQTHGMGDMATCSACHTSKDCSQCHGVGVPHTATFLVDHPDAAKSKSANCFSCHQKSFCIDCHGYQMPHPPSFLPTHPAIVKKNGQTACLRCHDPSDCSTCHTAHVHPTTLEEQLLMRLGLLGGSKVATP